MNIHILGNSPNMDKLLNFAKSNNLYLIEDTCEALGSKLSQNFGNFWRFWNFLILLFSSNNFG